MNPLRRTPQDVATQELQIQGGPLVAWSILALAVIGLVVLFLTGSIVVPPRADSPEAMTKSLQDLAARNAEFGDYVDNIRNRLHWDQTRNTLVQCKELCRELARSVALHEAELKALETSDAGSRIAAQPELVDQFLALRSLRRYSERECKKSETAIEELMSICDQAIRDRTIIVDCSEVLREEVRKGQTEFSGDLAEIRRQREALRLLVADSLHGPKSEELLNVVVARRQEEKTREFLRESAGKTEQNHNQDQSNP